jgi:ABC-2 type transport system permease protein
MRVRAVMVRILRQLKHDKRTIGLMLFAPILVLTLMSFIFGGSTYHPKIGVVNAPLHFVNSLEEGDAVVTRYSDADAEQALYNGDIDARVDFQDGVPHIKLEGSDPTKSKAVIALVKSASLRSSLTVQMEVRYLFGYKDMSSFDNFGPILIGFFVFFFVFLVSGIAFLGERNSGTLERLMATPVKRWEIVLGYVLGFGVFTILQSALIAWFSIYILHIMMVGSFALVLLITILTAMTALTIGIFISAFANNELQMIQFVPIIIVPQVFFSGLFDLSTMATWLQVIGKFTPLWYVADALRSIMIRGKGWSDISFDVLVLSLICLFFIIVNVFTLKKYRRI